MKKKIKYAFIILMALLLVSISLNFVSLINSNETKLEIDEKSVQVSQEQLMELERNLLQMFQEGNIDEAMSHLMEDAIVLPPGMDRVVGRDNQAVMFKELLKIEGVELSWEPIEAYIGPSNDMAYVYGSVEWKMPDEPRKYGKYISVWVKNDGKWMNLVEMRNSNN